MGAVDPTGVKPSARAAAARLRVDSATAEVLRAFDVARVQTVLLKGASNRQWLGDASGKDRWYADCDLLVRPQDGDAAERVLTALGFCPDFETRKMPAWWREHGLAWRSSDDGAIIDLHQTLPGVQVDDKRAWHLLSAGAEQIVVAGYPAQALAIPGRAMHLALHAAHHGPDWSMGLSDLACAVEDVDGKTWQAAAELAHQLGATTAFVAGLAMVSSGETLIERLELVPAPGMEVALLGSSARAPALTVERFVRAESLRIRLSIIWRKLVPPPTFMRHWSPLARRGRSGLLVAYGWRPVWVLAHALPAVKAWRRARRSMKD